MKNNQIKSQYLSRHGSLFEASSHRGGFYIGEDMT
jgi:hypothetical protein